MQKWVIIGIVLMLFGCAKSDEDKCKNKGWYWNESAKECTETAPAGTSTPAAETQESCKSKTRYIWNTESSQCKRIDYFMLIHHEDSEITNVFLGLKEGNNISVSKEAYPQKGGCIKVPESYVPNLIVQVKRKSWTIGGWNEECNSHAAEEEKKCKLGIYKLMLDDDDNVILQEIVLEEERTDCNVLELDSGN